MRPNNNVSLPLEKTFWESTIYGNMIACSMSLCAGSIMKPTKHLPNLFVVPAGITFHQVDVDHSGIFTEF
jgi:hypothetical protein